MGTCENLLTNNINEENYIGFCIELGIFVKDQMCDICKDKDEEETEE